MIWWLFGIGISTWHEHTIWIYDYSIGTDRNLQLANIKHLIVTTLQALFNVNLTRKP